MDESVAQSSDTNNPLEDPVSKTEKSKENRMLSFNALNTTSMTQIETENGVSTSGKPVVADHQRFEVYLWS